MATNQNPSVHLRSSHKM